MVGILLQFVTCSSLCVMETEWPMAAAHTTMQNSWTLSQLEILLIKDFALIIANRIIHNGH